MREAKFDRGQAGVGETVFALATAPGRAAVAVIRISGPATDEALQAISGALPPPRQLMLRAIRAANGMLIDRGMVVRFPEGASYTGEAMAELHLHGGRATVARALAELEATPGLRQAEPGEFTRRAMRNGRIDLARAEGLAELIDAETEMQRRQALAALDGGLAGQARLWREGVIDALGWIEATLDFSDEADSPDALPEDLGHELRRLASEIAEAAALAPGRERVREGFRVALVGPPNAGKSTLINAIAGEDVAISSATPGTTRDVIRVSCDLDGLPVVFLDMAGLRATADEVEALGVERGRRAAASADLRLFLAAPDAPDLAEEGLERPGDIRVWTKADLGAGPGWREISVIRGHGVKALLADIRTELAARAPASAVSANRRQSACLRDAAAALMDAASPAPAEIRAEWLRRAALSLELMIGSVAPDDVLDGVFRRFCIGK